MTNEDKKLIVKYMGWQNRPTCFDLNDAGLVVEEMQERYEWDEFMHYCWKYFPLGKDYIGRLFNADNFFNAFVQWRKTK